MIKFENAEVVGLEAAIRGMRNPMNSWEKSDSEYPEIELFNGDGEVAYGAYDIGPNDLDLMKRLRNAGTDHRKFMRMITVYVDITAPLYWWKEFDTYKVGTVVNSCSTMHKIHEKEFTLEDFSYEHLDTDLPALEYTILLSDILHSRGVLSVTINALNHWRDIFNNGLKNVDGTTFFIKPKSKDAWWQMIQLLPSSYNQKRTVMLNYEVLANIYKSRKNHKLDEWAEHSGSGVIGFCDWIKTLPYSELITGDFGDAESGNGKEEK